MKKRILAISEAKCAMRNRELERYLRHRYVEQLNQTVPNQVRREERAQAQLEQTLSGS